MGRPDPGSGQAEEGVEDAGAMHLDEAKDARVGRRVEQEGGEVLRASQQGGLDRLEEVGQGGEALGPELEGTGKGWCECSAGP